MGSTSATGHPYAGYLTGGVSMLLGLGTIAFGVEHADGALVLLGAGLTVGGLPMINRQRKLRGEA